MKRGFEGHEDWISRTFTLAATISSGSKFFDPGDAVTRGHDHPFPLYVDGKFCLDDQTEMLTRRGWLRHDQVLVGDETLGLRLDGTVSWTSVERVHAFPGHHDMVAWKMRGHDSLSTPNHRWLVERQRGKAPVYSWIETNDLGKFQLDAVVCARELVEYPEQKFSDALVELVGWYWTEGCINRSRGISIAQDPVANPENWASIQAALVSCFGTARAHGDGRAFYVGSREGKSEQIYVHAPGRTKHLSLDFVLSLTRSQLLLLIDTSIKADGHCDGRRRRIHQRLRESLDVLQIACQLAGLKSTMHQRKDKMWELALHDSKIIYPSGARLRGQVTITTVDGVVWCPVTTTGTWLARRNGTVYFTGNTDKASRSISLKELGSIESEALRLGKRMVMALRFWPTKLASPEDYVVLTAHDFKELLDLAVKPVPDKWVL